ncbi:MAG: ribonuclease HI family protein [Planctomycetes bacterium]|nr:ribonuclease HI family protein [Planctomycetota bacterium]
MAETGLLTINTDGASRGNPGAAAYAYVITRDGQLLVEEAGCLGEMTNNQAEYTALVRALEHALELAPDDRVVFHSDSELMVKQLNGEYRVKNEELRPLYEEAVRLRRQFKQPVAFRHVRREQNKRADELCNEALDGRRTNSRPAPSKASAPAEPPAPAPASLTAAPGLHEEAVACLRAATEAWARGAGSPSAEEVWQQLTALLQKHWLSQLAPPS